VPCENSPKLPIDSGGNFHGVMCTRRTEVIPPRAGGVFVHPESTITFCPQPTAHNSRDRMCMGREVGRTRLPRIKIRKSPLVSSRRRNDRYLERVSMRSRAAQPPTPKFLPSDFTSRDCRR